MKGFKRISRRLWLKRQTKIALSKVRKIVGEPFIALTQENLRLANECLELNQDGKMNVMLRSEIDFLKDQICQNDLRG